MHQIKPGGLLLMLMLMACFPLASHAQTDPSEHRAPDGVIYVDGSLTESACRMAMTSAWQHVDMGNIDTAQFRQTGDRGMPVKVAFQLKDCLPTGARDRDDRNGSMLWGSERPAMNIRFLAITDRVQPELVAMQGISGLGLRIQDEQGRDAHPDGKGRPLLLNPGQNTLVYTLTPVRTEAPLRGGAWHALIHVGLDYE